MTSATVRKFSQGLAFAIAAAGSSLAQADSVKIIYAAENALYGAGYDIGRADGWIDDSLRQAIRQYQTRSGNLNVTGNLDTATLSAMGITNGSGRTVTGNVVASKADALAALGVSDPKPRLKPKPAFAVKEEPAKVEPAAAKAPAPAPKKPEPKPEPVKVVAAVEATTPEPAKAPETAPAAKATSTKEQPRAQVAEPATDRVAKTKPIEEPKPIVVAASRQPAEVKPAPQTAQPAPTSADSTVSEASQNDATAAAAPETPAELADASEQLPTEPTSAGIQEAPAPEQSESAKKDRNIFGTLFDFLFGWMV